MAPSGSLTYSKGAADDDYVNEKPHQEVEVNKTDKWGLDLQNSR